MFNENHNKITNNHWLIILLILHTDGCQMKRKLLDTRMNILDILKPEGYYMEVVLVFSCTIYFSHKF